jgi:hypothetical protein
MQLRHLRPSENCTVAIDDEISRPHLKFGSGALPRPARTSAFFCLGAWRLRKRRLLFRFSSLPVSSAPFSFYSDAMLLPHSTSIRAHAETRKSRSLY